MKPSWRKPVGILGMLAALAVYTIVVVTLLEPIQRLPVLVQLIVYLIAGIVWILPMGRVMQWMETGRWR